MSDRTTINVPKSEHTAAGNVKERYDDTWADVLSFYATFKPQVNNGGLDAPRRPMQGVDSDEVAQKVVERLEGSKPLAEMEFEDWFEPDYAQTIASHIESEIMLSDVGVDYSPVLNRLDDLENTLPRKIGEELR